MANGSLCENLSCASYKEDPTHMWLVEGLIQLLSKNCNTKQCANRQLKGFHPKCTICKDIINDIKHKIENSPTEKDIKFRLEALCDALPVKDKCVDFVEKYTNKILNTLIDDINVNSVCAEIGYC